MLAKMSEILIYVSLKQTKDKNIPQIRVTSYAKIIATKDDSCDLLFEKIQSVGHYMSWLSNHTSTSDI